MADAKRVRHIIAVAVLIALTAILLPIFIINLTLTIRSNIDKTVPASVFGIAPLAVETDSMKGDAEDSFAGGALILVDMLAEDEKQQLEVGQIVTFRQKDDEGNYYFVTHRIAELGTEGGTVRYVVTRGDGNNVDDGATAIGDVLGVCVASVGGLGAAVMFLQTPVGMLLCIGVPVVAYIVYDVVRIALRNRRLAAEQGEAMQEKDAEIARLRALVDGAAGVEEVPFGDDSVGFAERAAGEEAAMGEEAPEGETADIGEELPDGEPAADEPAETAEQPAQEAEAAAEPADELTEEPAQAADEPADDEQV